MGKEMFQRRFQVLFCFPGLDLAVQSVSVGGLSERTQRRLENWISPSASFNRTQIHPRAFVGLPRLEELLLSGNLIKDARSAVESVRSLPALEHLDLSGNEIVEVHRNTFVGLRWAQSRGEQPPPMISSITSKSSYNTFMCVGNGLNNMTSETETKKVILLLVPPKHWNMLHLS